MAQFHSNLSDESDQDDSITATHIYILLKMLLTKQMIDTFLTTIWYHMDGCAKNYCCSSYICLIPCHVLWLWTYHQEHLDMKNIMLMVQILDTNKSLIYHWQSYQIPNKFEMNKCLSSSCRFMKMKKIINHWHERQLIYKTNR